MYIVVINRSLAKRNPLEDKVYNFLIDLNRMVIDEANIQDFKKHIHDKIASLNSSHKDFRPIQVGWSGHATDDDQYLTGVYFTTLNLYKTKRHFAKSLV